jgi:hypothetical protein
MKNRVIKIVIPDDIISIAVRAFRRDGEDKEAALATMEGFFCTIENGLISFDEARKYLKNRRQINADIAQTRKGLDQKQIQDNNRAEQNIRNAVLAAEAVVIKEYAEKFGKTLIKVAKGMGFFSNIKRGFISYGISFVLGVIVSPVSHIILKHKPEWLDRKFHGNPAKQTDTLKDAPSTGKTVELPNSSGVACTSGEKAVELFEQNKITIFCRTGSLIPAIQLALPVLPENKPETNSHQGPAAQSPAKVVPPQVNKKQRSANPPSNKGALLPLKPHVRMFYRPVARSHLGLS